MLNATYTCHTFLSMIVDACVFNVWGAAHRYHQIPPTRTVMEQIMPKQKSTPARIPCPRARLPEPCRPDPSPNHPPKPTPLPKLEARPAFRTWTVSSTTHDSILGRQLFLERRAQDPGTETISRSAARGICQVLKWCF